MADPQQILYLNPRDLLPSRENVRSDPGDLAGLAETIREHGILQPIGVTREEDGYRVVYGNRRREAAIVIGLDRVPCILVQGSDPQSVLIHQVLENLQRLDLNDLDKAQAFGRMLEHLNQQGFEQSEALDYMARTLGLSTRQIQRYLRLLRLPAEVRQYIAQGALGVTHAQHLAEIAPAARQAAVANLAVEEGLSAAELGRLCAALRRNTNIEPSQALALLRRGERVPIIEASPHETLEHLRPEPLSPAPWEEPSLQEAPEEEENALSRDDWASEDYTPLEPATRDGNRIRKFHSLDAFLDEVQRLTRCLQDGDLQRLIEQDPASRLKIGLAARQLRFLAEGVSALAEAENYS